MNAQPIRWIDPEDLDRLQAESIGWLPLEEGAYLHVGDEQALGRSDTVIEVVGVPDASMADANVLLLG